MKNHENRSRTMKNQPGTTKKHENLPRTMKNQPGNMKNQPGTMKNHKNRLGTMNNQPGNPPFPLFFAKSFLKNQKFKKQFCWHVQFIENISCYNV